MEAARAAGEIARRFFRADPKVWEKGYRDPVTEADIAIDTMLRGRLLAARPDYGWLSEETADDPARLDRKACFVVDPIDGTRAFIEGSRDFSHSLAIVRDGVPTQGVVHLPERDLLYAAEIGKGAWVGKGEGVGEPALWESRTIPAKDCRKPEGACVLENARILGAKKMFDPRRWRGGLPAKRCFRASLAYRLCLVAQGRFDAAIMLGGVWEWDVAAGVLIASEAGAVATWENGGVPRFNRGHPKGPGLIVGWPGVHAELIKRLRPAA